VGAALSGRILGNIGETWQRRTTLIFASVAVGCAGLSLYVGLMPNPEVGLAGTIFTSALSALMGAQARSEEHTSELQSRFDLVCRLLLEKQTIRFAPLPQCAAPTYRRTE